MPFQGTVLDAIEQTGRRDALWTAAIAGKVVVIPWTTLVQTLDKPVVLSCRSAPLLGGAKPARDTTGATGPSSESTGTTRNARQKAKLLKALLPKALPSTPLHLVSHCLGLKHPTAAVDASIFVYAAFNATTKSLQVGDIRTLVAGTSGPDCTAWQQTKELMASRVKFLFQYVRCGVFCVTTVTVWCHCLCQVHCQRVCVRCIGCNTVDRHLQLHQVVLYFDSGDPGRAAAKPGRRQRYVRSATHTHMLLFPTYRLAARFFFFFDSATKRTSACLTAADAALNAGQASKARSLLQRAFRLTPALLDELVQHLAASFSPSRVRLVRCVCEADTQIARDCLTGLVDIVVTNDTDAIVIDQVPVVLRGVSYKHATATVVSHADLCPIQEPADVCRRCLLAPV